MTRRPLPAPSPLVAAGAAATLGAGLAMVFFYAPLEADQGFVQKIFYLHVPLGIVSLSGFLLGAWFALRHLRTGDRAWDVRSYVAIHVSLILSVAVLGTGSIWARASWGHWWLWDEPMLVSYLIVFLLYCCYQPLRFSIEDPERQARAAAVFALMAGGFVPLNFVAVRLAQSVAHPRVLSATGGSMPGSMRVTFLVCLVAIALVYMTLYQLEVSRKTAAIELRRLRRAAERVRTAELATTTGGR
jgi:heme exporter protein C